MIQISNLQINEEKKSREKRRIHESNESNSERENKKKDWRLQRVNVLSAEIQSYDIYESIYWYDVKHLCRELIYERFLGLTEYKKRSLMVYFKADRSEPE